MMEKKRDDDVNVIENNNEEEPNFSDLEDFIDDITDDVLLPEIYQKKPREQDGFDSVIVVDNIPKVGAPRIEKLKSVLKDKFLTYGKFIGEPYYALDEQGLTKGYVFIEYETSEQASDALKGLNGLKLDRQHVLAVNLFKDIKNFTTMSDEFEPLSPQPYVDRGNLKSWLLNEECQDQYSVLYEEGMKTGIYWNGKAEPLLVKEREHWTESVVVWSPLGTYLATFHKQGLALWGGPEFGQINKFAHEGVSLIDFSPNEKYLVTFSPQYAASNDQQAIILWDLRTGVKKRCFHADQEQIVWPVFKWAHDDKYFARVINETLSIYETPSFMLLDKKSIKVNGIKSFSMSPSDNILAYWVTGSKDAPARVSLIDLPSKKEVRGKNFFNVNECKMYWQKSGNYLCVKVDRFIKLKKKEIDPESKITQKTYYNFEIFSMREKQIPIDSLELQGNVIAFAWEPVGNKFAIIHGEGEGPSYSVSFYGVKLGSSITLLKKFENKQCNNIFWSPTGQFVVLAGLRNNYSCLDFIDTSDFTITNSNEHFMVTDVEWDPTGRYVVTAVSWWVHKVDNAYWIWSFQGKLLQKINSERFCQLLWRPRPKTILPEDKLKEIKKNLKQYSAIFDEKDKSALTKASREILDKRRKLMEDFNEYRAKRAREIEQIRSELARLRGEEENDSDFYEETIEYLIKEDKKEIDNK